MYMYASVLVLTLFLKNPILEIGQAKNRSNHSATVTADIAFIEVRLV